MIQPPPKPSELNPDFELREWYVHDDYIVGRIYTDLSGTYPEGAWVTLSKIKSNTAYKDHHIIVIGKERDYFAIAYLKHKRINGF